MFEKTTVIIDATSESVKIALVENGKISAEKSSGNPAIESVAEAFAGVVDDPKKVGAYAICSGPGSMLGTRFASAFVSTLAALSEAGIFEWDSMKVAAFAIADSPNVPEKFRLIAPSRKGFANILDFDAGNIVREAEISLEEFASTFTTKTFLLDQRSKIPAEFESAEKFSPSPEQIFKTLSRRPQLAAKCGLPPDAKTLVKREFVKWKGQALI